MEVRRKDLLTILITLAVLLVLYLPVLYQNVVGGLAVWVFSFLVLVPYLRLENELGVRLWGVGWTTFFFVVVLL